MKWGICMKSILAALCLAGTLSTRGAAFVAYTKEQDSLSSAQDHHRAGIGALHIRQDSASARSHFLMALKIDSLYAPACYKLAEIELAAGRNAEALAWAEQARQQDSTNKFYVALHAHSLIQNARFEEALAAYEQLIRIDRHNPENYRVLALLKEQAGENEEAIRLLDSAEILFGRNSRLGMVKRRILLQNGEQERALNEARAQVEAVPYEPEGYVQLGDIYAATGNDSLARSAYLRALAIDSTNVETLITLGNYYNRKRDYGRGLEISRQLFASEEIPLEEKIRLYNQYTADMRFYREYYPQIGSLARTLALHHPGEPRVVELYARHLIALGEVEQALALYKERLREEELRVEYYHMTADLELYLEHPDSAEHYITRALKFHPNRMDLLLRKAHLTALNGHFELAEEAYRHALEQASTDSLRSNVWGYLGDLYQQQAQGDAPTAEIAFRRMKAGEKSAKKWLKKCYEAYDRALKYNRDNIAVLNNYAYFLALEERELNRALEMSSRVVALTENNPTYLDTHAWVLFKLGRTDEARPLLQQAVSRDGQKSPELQMHYGDVLAALGEYFMAEIYWKRALENGYDPSEVELRIEALKQHKATQQSTKNLRQP